MKGFDKKGWKKITFGEVCINVNETEKDPLGNGIERYVGLEHIETESLHIKTWGNVAEGTTFTKSFKKGQVLFGKRRAYLKKAAVAEFDGLCSGDILVFEANENIIDKRLFPFLVSSDRFFDYAVQTSAGSLSPRTKFQDLAKFEFLLPPKEQQAQLAELLWAADETIENFSILDSILKECIQCFLDNKFNEIEHILKLKDCIIGKPQYGANAPSKPFVNGNPRYIRITDLNDEGYLIEEDKVSIDSLDFEDYLLKNGDFLFARTGNTVGKTLLYKTRMGYCVFAGYLIRFQLNEKVLDPEFLDLFCRTSHYRDFIKKSAKVGAQPNVNADQYSNMEIPVPSVSTQREILKTFAEMKNGLTNCREVLNKTFALYKKLINQVF